MNSKRQRFATAFHLMVFLATAVPAGAAELEARGLIKARHRTVLSSEIVGRVMEIPYRHGAAFPKGAVLVRFDCSLLKAEEEKAAAGLEAARVKLETHQALEKLQSIGAMEVALDRAYLSQRSAELRIASLAVNRCEVRAPYAGKVVRVLADEHQSVRAQQELLEILTVRPLEIEVMVPSTWLSWLRSGHRFRVVIDETGLEFPARVTAVGAAVEPVSKMVLLRGRLEKTDPSLVPGMGAVAYFTTGRAPAESKAIETPAAVSPPPGAAMKPRKPFDGALEKETSAPNTPGAGTLPESRGPTAGPVSNKAAGDRRQAVPAAASGFTTADRLHLRAAPSTEGAILAKAPEKGTRVSILAEKGDWFYVEYNGHRGYMYRRYVKKATETR